MMYNKMYVALIVFFSAAAALAFNQAFAGSGAAQGGRSASTHLTSHASVARSQHHYKGRHTGALWSTAGGVFYGPANGESEISVTEALSGDTHYTCTLDTPWDWVHRCPPLTSPSSSPNPIIIPSVPSCPAQTVTVPMDDGKVRTITIVRC